MLRPFSRSVALCAALLVSAHAQAQVAEQPLVPKIDWQVHNRFRLFNDEAAKLSGADNVLAQANKVLDALSLTDFEHAYSAYAPLIQAVAFESDPKRDGLFRHTHYDREGWGDYGRPYALTRDPPYITSPNRYVDLREQAIDASVSGVDPTQSCEWKLDGRVVATRRCGETAPISVRFADGAFGASANLEVKAGDVVASTVVHTKDVLIVAMGDSYSAGEGSPDQPADATRFKVAAPFDAAHPDRWWRPGKGGAASKGPLPQDASADWWSEECHRSLFSPQVLAAMKVAASDKHRSVTFLSYACAGASVLDGLLTPQAEAPGRGRMAMDEKEGKVVPEGYAMELSQLERAVSDLCRTNKLAYDPYAFDMDRIPTWRKILYDRVRGDDPFVPRCTDWVRHPDIVFLTIGGNDIGFAGLATWGLTPFNLVKFKAFPGLNAPATTAVVKLWGDFKSWNGLGIVCPDVPFPSRQAIPTGFFSRLGGLFDSHQDPRCVPGLSDNLGAKELVSAELPYLLHVTQDFFDQSGLLGGAVVIQETYPAPLHDENGHYCGETFPTGIFRSTEDLREPWRVDEAVAAQIGELQIYLDRKATPAIDAVAFGQDVAEPSLVRAIHDAGREGWIVAPAPSDFAKHGVCAVDPADTLMSAFGFPRAEKSGFKADHPSPSQWQAYGHRARWLRTSDDSLLTEAVSDDNGMLLDESTNGAIHPTAEGQAAVADQLFSSIPADRR